MINRHCLIIDDDAIATTFLSEWMSAHGWQVVCARTLAEAARALAASRFDIALVDRRLPDGDGLVWLATNALASTTRCLVTSGETIDAGDLPANVACLRKPLDVDRLQAWLAQSDTGASTAITEGAAAPEVAPLLDDSLAVTRYGGNIQALRSLRAMLLSELRDSGPWRSQLRKAPPANTALDALHRLRAASALTGCVRLGQVSETLEADLRRGLPGDTRSLQRLDDTIDATIAAITAVTCGS